MSSDLLPVRHEDGADVVPFPASDGSGHVTAPAPAAGAGVPGS
ncbi:hypothetical protein [Geodermatophilus normandii]|nr:hypothetical protein [Geodermatophilus normandii]